MRNPLFHVPAYVHGGVVASRLGFTLLRILFWRLCVALRPSCGEPAESIKKDLDRDGVAIIPNFLSKEDHQRVAETFQKLREEKRFRNLPNRNGTNVDQLRLNLTDTQNDDLDWIRRLFNCRPEISKSLSYLSKKAYPKSRRVLLYTVSKHDPSRPNLDQESSLHFDHFVPCSKAFYFVNDHNKENGSYIYAKGSFRLTFWRLRYEYWLSVYKAQRRKNGRLSPSDNKDATDLALGKIERHVSPKQIIAPANTLVISNNMGLHARGEIYSPDADRRQILISHR